MIFSGLSALWTGIHTDIEVANVPGHYGVLIPKLVLLWGGVVTKHLVFSTFASSSVLSTTPEAIRMNITTKEPDGHYACRLKGVIYHSNLTMSPGQAGLRTALSVRASCKSVKLKTRKMLELVDLMRTSRVA